MKKTRKAYSAEFKREAVRLVKGGLTASQVARDLGVVGNVVARWVREDQGDPDRAFPGQGKMKVDEAEVDRLRKEIIKLKAERDLLKKATAYFAKEST
jgi:transposase